MKIIYSKLLAWLVKFDQLKEDNKGHKIDERRLRKAVKEFMRPAIDSVTLSFVGLSIDNINKSTRGNSAIFVCPYCMHSSDADIQAAYNIAVKGWLKARYKVANNNKLKGFTNQEWRKEIADMAIINQWPTIEYERQ